MPAKLKTRQAIADATGKSLSTVARWLREGCPRPPTTKRAVERWVAARPDHRAKPATRDVDTELASDAAAQREGGKAAAWNVRYRKAKAEAAELDLAERRGDLISREEVEAGHAARVTEVRNALAVLPRRVALRFPPEIRQRLEEVMEAELNEICDGYAREPEILTRKRRRRAQGG